MREGDTLLFANRRSGVTGHSAVRQQANSRVSPTYSARTARAVPAGSITALSINLAPPSQAAASTTKSSPSGDGGDRSRESRISKYCGRKPTAANADLPSLSSRCEIPVTVEQLVAALTDDPV